jgi:hypothetical protein
MRIAQWLLLFIQLSFGAAFAQSTDQQKPAQKHDKPAKPSAAKPLKDSKDADKGARKHDKETAASSAKKVNDSQNQVNAQAYKTTVPKP